MRNEVLDAVTDWGERGGERSSIYITIYIYYTYIFWGSNGVDGLTFRKNWYRKDLRR